MERGHLDEEDDNLKILVLSINHTIKTSFFNISTSVKMIPILPNSNYRHYGQGSFRWEMLQFREKVLAKVVYTTRCPKHFNHWSSWRGHLDEEDYGEILSFISSVPLLCLLCSSACYFMTTTVFYADIIGKSFLYWMTGLIDREASTTEDIIIDEMASKW